MLPFLAAVLAGAASGAGAADVQLSDVPAMFQATCLDGQARLRSSEVSPISFDQLPPALKQSLGQPASGKVWQINSAGRSYLYLLDYNAAPGVSPKVCGVASETMDLKTAGDMLEARITGSVGRNRGRSAQWLNAKDGYVATATTASSLNVLQISWMSDTDRAAAEQQIELMPK